MEEHLIVQFIYKNPRTLKPKQRNHPRIHIHIIRVPRQRVPVFRDHVHGAHGAKIVDPDVTEASF